MLAPHVSCRCGAFDHSASLPMCLEDVKDCFIVVLTAVEPCRTLSCVYFEAWQMVVGSLRGRIMWKASFMVIIWVACEGRNRQCFEGYY